MNKRTILSALCIILGLLCIMLTFSAPNGFTLGIYLVVGIITLLMGLLGIKYSKS
ncbi:hypothetical protein [Paenibacillus sp. R14(2021)]|uniref:hypothetical protein n=1 Tax=Paenibacillus sp. R14(2021) TaxID=2859228 RepID=UPI001C612A3B|nr:hypothetical protein [Paenibacillus sp. R14(2021)]